MGYQVGWQCVSDSAKAADLVLSGSQPFAFQDRIKQYEKQPDGSWALVTYDANYQRLSSVQASLQLPECSPLQQFNDGLQLGWLFFLLALTLWGSRQVRRFF